MFKLINIKMKKMYLQSALIMILLVGMLMFSCKKDESDTPKDTALKQTEIEWVSLETDTFYMGCLEKEFKGIVLTRVEENQHDVSLHAYCISKYEVTFDQYDYFCEQTNRTKPDDNGFGRGKRPVINVSYYDALDYAKFMGCRLPTEAEWEYACRGVSFNSFYLSKTHYRRQNLYRPFNTGDSLTNKANFDATLPYFTNPIGIKLDKTVPVGSYAPNAFGLYDMHGNVMEWCSDWFDYYYPGSQFYNYTGPIMVDPQGPETGKDKVLRGGSFATDAFHSRSANRFHFDPNYKGQYVGFRLAKDL